MGPNPALTILALAERAMEIAVAQLESEGEISPQRAALARELDKRNPAAG